MTPAALDWCVEVARAVSSLRQWSQVMMQVVANLFVKYFISTHHLGNKF